MSNMLKRFSFSATASSATLICLGILLADPFDISMNNMVLIVVSGMLLASFALFAGLLWKERAADEREAVLVDKAGRFGYIAGMSTLTIGIVVQSFTHDVDVWLVLTVSMMIIAKHAFLGVKK